MDMRAEPMQDRASTDNHAEMDALLRQIEALEARLAAKEAGQQVRESATESDLAAADVATGILTVAQDAGPGATGAQAAFAQIAAAPAAQAMVVQGALPGAGGSVAPTVGEVLRPGRAIERAASPTLPAGDTQAAPAAEGRTTDAARPAIPAQPESALASGFHFEPGASASDNAAALASQESARFGQAEAPLRPLMLAEAQAPAPNAAAPGATREIELRAHPSSPVWREGFAAQVSVLVGERVQSAQMRVHPPELGPVDIRIVTMDQQTSIVFSAAHEDTRRAIEDAMPRLREVLAESGVNVDSASVNSDHPKEDFHRQAHADARRGAGHAQPGKPDDSEPAAVAAPLRLREGLIDTFA